MQCCVKVRVSEQQAGRQATKHSFLPPQLLSLVERHVSRRGRSQETLGPRGSDCLQHRKRKKWESTTMGAANICPGLALHHFWAYMVWSKINWGQAMDLTIEKDCTNDPVHFQHIDISEIAKQQMISWGYRRQAVMWTTCGQLYLKNAPKNQINQILLIFLSRWACEYDKLLLATPGPMHFF